VGCKEAGKRQAGCKEAGKWDAGKREAAEVYNKEERTADKEKWMLIIRMVMTIDD